MLWSRLSNVADMSRAVRILFSRVNYFHNIVSEFEQSGISGMQFAIGRLHKEQKLGDIEIYGIKQ